MTNVLKTWILLLFTFFVICNNTNADTSYVPTHESLRQHEIPEWLLDAKFGIWTHWSPITYAIQDATEQMGWYAGNMYVDGSNEQHHHLKHYGPIKEVGYGDLCKQFNPVNFNAEEWAELFAQAGARFAGPTAVHHDNFAMWDSELTPWNAADMGPKRDLVGEMAAAFRNQNMRLLLSYHHGYSWFYYRDVYDYEQPTQENILLFGEPRPMEIAEFGKAPSSYQERWLAMINEANSKYQPDIIWHDFGLQKNITPEFRDRFLADYYNMGQQWTKEVEALIRDFDLTKTVGMNTMEKGVRGYLDPVAWNKNTSISQEWFAFSPKNGVQLMSIEELVHDLIDTVSKNGTYILNVGPNADGTIRDIYKKRLKQLGQWLKVNGDAIYATRPWRVYGEFPRGIPTWRFVGHVTPSYDSRDVRYTQSKDGGKVYAIVLGWPRTQVLKLNSPKVLSRSPGAQVRLLGYSESVPFQIDGSGKILVELEDIDLSKLNLRSPAFSFELRGFNLGLTDNYERYCPNIVGLHPEEASFDGWGLRAEPDPRGTTISRWVTDTEIAHWYKKIPETGECDVIVRYSLREEKDFPLQFVYGDQTLDFELHHTGADIVREVSIGRMNISNGFQEFVLRLPPNLRPPDRHLKIFEITLVPMK